MGGAAQAAQLPRGADERDRARFAKAQSYMVRRDDKLACANMRCRKPFEITAAADDRVFDGVDTLPDARLHRPTGADPRAMCLNRDWRCASVNRGTAK